MNSGFLGEIKNLGDRHGSSPFRIKYKGIWYLVAVLLVLCVLFVPASVKPNSLRAIMPFIAFLTIAAMGEALIIMVGGLDVSIPAVIGMTAVSLVALTGGDQPNVLLAILFVLLASAAVGLFNGILISIFGLNPLLVTLSVNTILTGGMLLYLQTMRFESQVAHPIESFGLYEVMNFNVSVPIALGLVLILTVILDFTPLGRRFRAVGSNPTAARIAGMPVARYQIGAYIVGALLYAITGILLSAFVVSPNKDAGRSYFLAPIAAVVLGTGSLSGGLGSMVATMGGAFFYIQLGQVLKTMGASGYVEYLLLGLCIGGGMAATNPKFIQWIKRVLRLGRKENKKNVI
ncbi:MAG: ABC transporter permease [Anaerolineales bacterium]|nr:ABC transporter permease [Anaerolineales bacterium]